MSPNKVIEDDVYATIDGKRKPVYKVTKAPIIDVEEDPYADISF